MTMTPVTKSVMQLMSFTGCCWQWLVSIGALLQWLLLLADAGLFIFIAQDYCRESIHFGNASNIRLSLMVRHVRARQLVQYQNEILACFRRNASARDFLIRRELSVNMSFR